MPDGESKIGIHEINIHESAHHAASGKIRDIPIAAAVHRFHKISRATHATNPINVLGIRDVHGAKKPFMPESLIA